MNDVAYQIRVRRAAQQLSGVSSAGLGSPTMRQFRYRDNSGGTLGACDCGSPRLRGRKAQRVGSYKLVTAMRTGLSGVSGLGIVARPVAALIPISDRSAVTAAVKMFASRRQQGLHGYKRVNIGGLADTQQAQGAVGGAASGAEVGTAIFPGVGTVIGAVVGAVVGWLAVAW